MSTRNSRQNRRNKHRQHTKRNDHSNGTPLEKIAKSADAELLDNNQEEPRRHLVNHTKFEGPLPHPDIFKKYGEIIPDAPERILTVFEQDSIHIRDTRTRVLEVQKQDNARVHWMAWSLILGGYIVAVLFAWMDKNWLSGLTLTSTIGGTILGFIQNKRSPNNQS